MKKQKNDSFSTSSGKLKLKAQLQPKQLRDRKHSSGCNCGTKKTVTSQTDTTKNDILINQELSSNIQNKNDMTNKHIDKIENKEKFMTNNQIKEKEIITTDFRTVFRKFNDWVKKLFIKLES